MRIVLHLGAHRTGTSALQRAMALGGAALERRGVAAPPTPDLRRRICGALDMAAGARFFAGARRAWAAARIRDMAARAARDGATRLVLSDEQMLGRLDAMFAPCGLYHDAEARLELLAEALAPWPTRAAICLRDPGDWIASCYAYAAERRAQPDFEDLRPRMLEVPARFCAVLGAARAAFPRSVIWRHDLALARPRRVLRALVGAAADDLDPVRRDQNRALSGPAIAEIIRLRAAGRRVSPKTRAALAQRWPLAAHGPFAPWSAGERAALAAGLADELARLGAAGIRRVDADDPAPNARRAQDAARNPQFQRADARQGGLR